MALDFADKINEANERVESLEQLLGKGLIQPFTNCNAGARKIMHGTHRDHVFPLISGEKAIIETGYEIRFGDYSSSITAADSDYTVIAKISKYSFSPNHHYYVILQDNITGKLDVVERISYHHITESYGYLYNNDYLDSLQVGSKISKGTIVQKSMAFDKYCNRQDGINLNTVYLALDDNMEDSILISESASKKLMAPLIKPVTIMINDNDIPLNLYGDGNMYKAIPDIGEVIDNAVLQGLRKEKKDEAMFMQSVQMLRELLISDEKYSLRGTVIDVNIYCNNPDILDGIYYGQYKMYYNELQRTASEIVSLVTPYVAQGCELSYDMQKLFANSKRIVNKDLYMGKRAFSNMILEIVVLEEIIAKVGDKGANRYGGKGVISRVVPDDLMIKFGDNEIIDIIFNSSTMYNRENPGQLFEMSLSHIGCEMIKYFKRNKDTMSPDDMFAYVLKYISHISMELHDSYIKFWNSLSMEDKYVYMENMIDSGAIHLSIKPASESMDIDRLAEIYDDFPFIEQTEIRVPLRGSNGKIRFVPARRKVVVGKQYFFRLKQFAEEKFSATNLSATNIRNENTKSKANREYKELHSNTPIRFGNMESNDMNHIGSEHVVTNMMVHSLSPHGRQLVEQMYIDEPFNVDIRPNYTAKNRVAEIIHTYIKTIGKRFKFIKIKKHREKATIECPIVVGLNPPESPIYYNKMEGFDFEKDYQERQEFLKEKVKANAECPIYYEPRRWDSPIRRNGIDSYLEEDNKDE